MHASSFENMLKCYKRYISGTKFEEQPLVEVLDIGGADVNGTYRSIFADTKFRYRTADVESNSGVDVVLTDPYSLPIDDRSIDIVISGQAFEHIEFFWQTFSEMVRILKPDGLIYLTLRKKASKVRSVPHKYIAPHTYLPLEGNEKDIIHYFFNKKRIKKELNRFKLIKLSRSKDYYYFLGKKV